MIVNIRLSCPLKLEVNVTLKAAKTINDDEKEERTIRTRPTFLNNLRFLS